MVTKTATNSETFVPHNPARADKSEGLGAGAGSGAEEGGCEEDDQETE